VSAVTMCLGHVGCMPVGLRVSISWCEPRASPASLCLYFTWDQRLVVLKTSREKVIKGAEVLYHTRSLHSMDAVTAVCRMTAIAQRAGRGSPYNMSRSCGAPYDFIRLYMAEGETGELFGRKFQLWLLNL